MDYVDDNGKKGIRILFYLQGLRKRARAEIDAREVSLPIVVRMKLSWNFWIS